MESDIERARQRELMRRAFAHKRDAERLWRKAAALLDATVLADGAHGVSADEVELMLAIEQHEHPKARQYAVELDVTEATISRLLASLRDRGYVERDDASPYANKRQHPQRMTAAGRRFLDQLVPLAEFADPAA